MESFLFNCASTVLQGQDRHFKFPFDPQAAQEAWIVGNGSLLLLKLGCVLLCELVVPVNILQEIIKLTLIYKW